MGVLILLCSNANALEDHGPTFLWNCIMPHKEHNMTEVGVVWCGDWSPSCLQKWHYLVLITLKGDLQSHFVLLYYAFLQTIHYHTLVTEPSALTKKQYSSVIFP